MFLVLLLALVFCILQVPLFVVPDGQGIAAHDPSAQAALEYWTLHHFQYGKDVIQNVGPLGFIDYPQLYTGLLDGEKFALNVGLTILFAGLIITISRKLPKATGYVLLLNTMLFSSVWNWNVYLRSADTRNYVLMLLIAYMFFFTDSLYTALGLMAILALLSLAKGTFLFIALLVVLVACFHFLTRRKPLFALGSALSYILSLVLCWLACGQNLANLPAFLSNMLGLTEGYASGYLDSMFVYEDYLETVAGVTLSLLAAYAILTKYVSAIGNKPSEAASRLGLAGIEFFILFIVWKHSYVRANLHLILLFYFLSMALPLFFRCSSFAVSSDGRLQKLNGIFLGIGIALCYLAIVSASMTVHKGGKLVFNGLPEFAFNIEFFGNLRGYFSQKQHTLQENIDKMQLPYVQKTIGDKGIGYFGFSPAIMIYNPFHYQFMPNTISFTAWSHFNIQNDAGFFRDDATAPPFLLYRQGTLDNRLSAQDDPLAQLEILQHYEPLPGNAIQGSGKELLFLKRRSHAAALAFKPWDAPKQVRLGYWIDVPADARVPLRVRIHLHNGALFRLLRLIYKPPEYAIEFKLDDGRIQSRKFMPTMAEDGFMIAPLIEDNRAFLNVFIDSEYRKYLLHGESSLKRMVKLRITCVHLAIACAQDMEMSFESVQGLELGRIFMPTSGLQ